MEMSYQGRLLVDLNNFACFFCCQRVLHNFLSFSYNLHSDFFLVDSFIWSCFIDCGIINAQFLLDYRCVKQRLANLISGQIRDGLFTRF